MQMWWNGKHARFRSLWEQSLAGSSPVICTNHLKIKFSNSSSIWTGLSELRDARSSLAIPSLSLLTSPSLHQTHLNECLNSLLFDDSIVRIMWRSNNSAKKKNLNGSQVWNMLNFSKIYKTKKHFKLKCFFIPFQNLQKKQLPSLLFLKPF